MIRRSVGGVSSYRRPPRGVACSSKTEVFRTEVCVKPAMCMGSAEAALTDRRPAKVVGVGREGVTGWLAGTSGEQGSQGSNG